MFDAKVVNRISKDGKGGVIVEVELVCNVTMYKDFAGLASQKHTFRDTRVGTTYPEHLVRTIDTPEHGDRLRTHLGSLTFCTQFKKMWFDTDDISRPLSIRR